MQIKRNLIRRVLDQDRERPSSGSRTSLDRSENIPVIHLLAVEDDIEMLTNHSMERLFEAWLTIESQATKSTMSTLVCSSVSSMAPCSMLKDKTPTVDLATKLVLSRSKNAGST